MTLLGRFALPAALALLLGTSRVSAASAAAGLEGNWTGTVDLGQTRRAASAVAAFARLGTGISGTITVDGPDGSHTFSVAGSAHVRRARLIGVSGSERLRWKARWSSTRHAWGGPLRMGRGAHRVHGRLVLTQSGDGGPGSGCGADYFAQELMPRVFEPICAQCHVPAGLARSTRLRVTVGDAPATARSAMGLVDTTHPAQSYLLLKPRGEVAHGGGQRIVPGSAEDQALERWVALVTSPDCGGGSGGGGGGGTGDLYTDHCASCHGPDARGVDGRPDIHCNRAIHDVVRNGRGPAGEMPAFPDLTEADIATIQDFLLGLCPRGAAGGDELYAGNCASCHGADAGGATDAPGIRCATRVADAVQVGRGARMPSMLALVTTDVASIAGFLAQLCTQHGRTGADLYAGNCSTCHGADANGGRNGLGVRGPEIQCTGANDYREKVQRGDDDMPAFPALSAGDVSAIVTFVHGAYCSGG